MKIKRCSILIGAMLAAAAKADATTLVTTISTYTTAVMVSTTSTVTAPPAPLVTDDPPAAHYTAAFPQGGSQNVVGLCAAEAPTNTTVGTLFTFNIDGAPEDGGPFCKYSLHTRLTELMLTIFTVYHIHEFQVPANGSCEATGGHLDPQNRGESPPCDATQPQTCQVGDLSGKHGDMPTIPGFSAQYIDNYISLNPDDAAFMGNRSIVIHDNNSTRLACANWVPVTNATNSTNATTTSTGTLVTGTSVTGPALTNSETASKTSATASSSSSGNGASAPTAALGQMVVGFGPLAAIAVALMV